MSQVSKRLRVLHVVPDLLPNNCIGGAERMAGDLMIALSEQHEVAALSLYELTGSTLEKRLRQAGVLVEDLRKRPGFDPGVIRDTDRVIARFRPHVVHTHLYVLRYVLPALLHHRVPLAVHTVHNQAEYEADVLGRMIRWFAFRRRVVPVAISNQIARSVERVYGIQCRTVIPNCISVERFGGTPIDRTRWRAKHGFDGDDLLLTFAGRLHPQKDPLLLVQAVADVVSPRVHLLIVGDGVLYQPVAELVRALSLEPRVHLLGKLDDIAPCLAASDIFVMSSRWEGNPLTVMEAMASGLPVVGTAVGGVPDLVESGQHGVLVPPGQPAQLAAAMEFLCRNPGTRRSMAAAARERAIRHFSLRQMVGAYDDLYQSALGTRRSLQTPDSRHEGAMQ